MYCIERVAWDPYRQPPAYEVDYLIQKYRTLDEAQAQCDILNDHTERYNRYCDSVDRRSLKERVLYHAELADSDIYSVRDDSLRLAIDPWATLAPKVEYPLPYDEWVLQMSVPMHTPYHIPGD